MREQDVLMLAVLQASHPARGERTLMPHELLSGIERVIADRTAPVTFDICTDFFVDELRAFAQAEAAAQAAVRKRLGLPPRDAPADGGTGDEDGLHRDTRRGREERLTVGADPVATQVVGRMAGVTRTQLHEFMRACVGKYATALIQPGAPACSLVVLVFCPSELTLCWRQARRWVRWARSRSASPARR
jgi:hypothetical protein